MKKPSSYDAAKAKLEENRQDGNSNDRVEGIWIDVFSGVFSPLVYDDAKFFAEHVPKYAGKKFLEIGSGSGAVSLVTKLNNRKNTEVTAVDINPRAVDNTYCNFRKHKAKGSIFLSDLFSAIPKRQKFDTIFWNIPFVPYVEHKMDDLDRAVFDPNYKSFNKFLSEAPNHLEELTGHLLIGFSSEVGNKKLFDKKVAKNGFVEKWCIRSGPLENIERESPDQDVRLELYNFEMEQK